MAHKQAQRRKSGQRKKQALPTLRLSRVMTPLVAVLLLVASSAIPLAVEADTYVSGVLFSVKRWLVSEPSPPPSTSSDCVSPSSAKLS